MFARQNLDLLHYVCISSHFLQIHANKNGFCYTCARKAKCERSRGSEKIQLRKKCYMGNWFTNILRKQNAAVRIDMRNAMVWKENIQTEWEMKSNIKMWQTTLRRWVPMQWFRSTERIVNASTCFHYISWIKCQNFNVFQENEIPTIKENNVYMLSRSDEIKTIAQTAIPNVCAHRVTSTNHRQCFFWIYKKCRLLYCICI